MFDLWSWTSILPATRLKVLREGPLDWWVLDLPRWNRKGSLMVTGKKLERFAPEEAVLCDGREWTVGEWS